MTTLREAIEQTVAILGPEAPLCSGCVAEWTEALRILNDALAEQPAEPVAWIDPKHLEWLSQSPDNMTGAGLAARKPKNSDLVPLYTAPQPAKPAEQEPVAYIGMIDEDHFADVCRKAGGNSSTPLYTAPQPAKQPLTDEEIVRLWYPSAAVSEPGKRRVAFARAIERAHGIGEQE